MLVATGKRKVKPIFRKSSSTEHLLLLPVDVPLQRVHSTKQPLTSDSSGDDWSSHFTIQTKDAFWLPLHYIILYLYSHPSASHRTKSLHLSQILNGLNRAECGGPHTKARRGKHHRRGQEEEEEAAGACPCGAATCPRPALSFGGYCS